MKKGAGSKSSTNAGRMKLERADLVSLLIAAQKSEADVRSAARQSMGIYSTILIAVIGGTLAGLQATREVSLLSVFIAVAGGVVTALMAFAAQKHCLQHAIEPYLLRSFAVSHVDVN